MRSAEQLGLMGDPQPMVALPRDYEPVRPAHFEVASIILAKGSMTTPERRRFVERICDPYPEAPVEARLDTPHNQLALGERDRSPSSSGRQAHPCVRRASDGGTFRPGEGKRLPELLALLSLRLLPLRLQVLLPGRHAGRQVLALGQDIRQPARDAGWKSTALPGGSAHRPRSTSGKLQDSLALDPLTAYSTVLVPFFAEHPWARLTLLTKSAKSTASWIWSIEDTPSSRGA